jgi:hypothetical protein
MRRLRTRGGALDLRSPCPGERYDRRWRFLQRRPSVRSVRWSSVVGSLAFRYSAGFHSRLPLLGEPLSEARRTHPAELAHSEVHTKSRNDWSRQEAGRAPKHKAELLTSPRRGRADKPTEGRRADKRRRQPEHADKRSPKRAERADMWKSVPAG